MGFPLRCSIAGTNGPTGLSEAANDTSEGQGGDGLVAEIIVNPGDSYFLVIDNFTESGSASLTFGGTGAANLDCNATIPSCAIEVEAMHAWMDICIIIYTCHEGTLSLRVRLHLIKLIIMMINVHKSFLEQFKHRHFHIFFVNQEVLFAR